MNKIYEVHITSKEITSPFFYFVEIATGKHYKPCKYPEGFEELDEATKNEIVVFITNEGGVDENYGSYNFEKNPFGDLKFFGIKMAPKSLLCVKLTEYGKKCELKKDEEETYRRLSESAL